MEDPVPGSEEICGLEQDGPIPKGPHHQTGAHRLGVVTSVTRLVLDDLFVSRRPQFWWSAIYVVTSYYSFIIKCE